MPPRASISNLVISLVLVFFLFLLALILKARFRLPSEQTAAQATADTVPHAIPVAVPVEAKTTEHAYKSGGFWVIPHPEFVPGRANEPDTLRIRSGPKEDIFVLYGVDGAQNTWTHIGKLKEQEAVFNGASTGRVLDVGGKALAWVTKTLSDHPFIVYTQWARVPDTERYYAFVRVEMEPGKQQDLGEMLVRRGMASPTGVPPKAMPEAGRTPDNYHHDLAKAMTQAKSEGAGLWAPQG